MNELRQVVMRPTPENGERLREALEVHGLDRDLNEIHFPDAGPHPLIYYAVCTRVIELVQLLLEMGADPNLVFVPGAHVEFPDDDRSTALCAAIPDTRMVTLLLDHGADPNLPKRAGLTALMDAAGDGRLDIVELLLASGADPLAKSMVGETPLRLAAAARDRGVDPEGKVLRRLWRAAQDAARGRKGSTLVCRRRKSMLDPASDRGVGALRSLYQWGEADWAILPLASEVEHVSAVLADVESAPRREEDVAKRLVVDSERLYFVFELKGLPWTLVPLQVGAPVRQTREMERLAADAAKRLECRGVLLYATTFYDIAPDGALRFWAPGGGDPDEVPRSVLDELDGALAEREVLVPGISFDTDGYHVQLCLHGVRKRDVGRVDVVVLEELFSEGDE